MPLTRLQRTAFFLGLLLLSGFLYVLLSKPKSAPDETAIANPSTELPWMDFFNKHLLPTLPIADGFDFPVRPPNGEGTYLARKFWEKQHLGEDWNTAPENGDLGEPIYASADGWVSTAMNFEGMWGKVVLIVSRLPEGRWPPTVELMYAHLQEIEVLPFAMVKRGQRIGTMGNADGVYFAHLHWEVRQTPGLGLGGGYGDRRDGWLNPTEFVLAHRPPQRGPEASQNLPEREKEKWGQD